MAGLRLKAELGGDGSGFDAMMRRANATKDKFGISFAGLKGVIAGAFTVGAITNLSRKTIEMAGHLKDVSEALRVNVEWFQKRANAAKLSGGSADDLVKFIDTMNKSREEAFNNPEGEKSQRFARMGFSQSDISDLPTMEFFDRIVEAYKKGASGQMAVDVEDVGGKSARKLLAGFQTGMESSASIMTKDVVNQLDEVGDKWQMLKDKALTGLAPILGEVIDGVMKFGNWMKVLAASLEGARDGKIHKMILEKLAENAPDAKTRRFAKKQLAAFNAGGGVEGYADRLLENEIRAQQKKAADLAAAQKAAADLQTKAENTGPGYTKGNENKDDKEAKLPKVDQTSGPALPTDSLVGVGNFLGRNPGLVNSVASQQLQVARSQLQSFNIMAKTTAEILAALKANPLTSSLINFPT